ncbi:TPA: hypothetical protein I3301_002186 [Enterobacter cloacae subsp. cloacae]|uniref:hypothetical protein n=1 Tax=Enterobacter cloacae complex TaxID=354276 RepID=UPI001066485E|nr:MULTISPECIES: hypothetical protein [Enterobacter cloacae complex]ELK3456365.1 hypothetical protein [Enterobacter kobei]MBJ6377887.1 hypothetical protein [Enterobacter hormaechei]HAS0886390.1 hypothetical protein [Enterobacter cloacae subsp. cloacae]HCT5171381.1 hypothetical protein [Enterobacter cloacae]
MELNIITLIKSILAGAGTGFAVTGGVSIAIPALTVSTTLALTMAGVGAAAFSGLYIKKKLVN